MLEKQIYMIFSNRMKDYSCTIMMNNIKINRVFTTKFLGVYIDNHACLQYGVIQFAKSYSNILIFTILSLKTGNSSFYAAILLHIRKLFT